MPVTRTLAGAAQQYLDDLRAATEGFEHPSADHGRESVIRALTATTAFIAAASSRLPLAQSLEVARLSAPFVTLATCLYELADGAVHPMIAPGKVQNRRVISNVIRMGRAALAAAMELLVLSGVSRTAAAKLVASWTEGADVYAGSKRAPWIAIAAWRDDIRTAPDRVSLDEWGKHRRARPDVVVFDYWIGEARLRVDRGEWDATSLSAFARSVAADTGWTTVSKKGRAKMET